jgi:hypothetical protein
MASSHVWKTMMDLALRRRITYSDPGGRPSPDRLSRRAAPPGGTKVTNDVSAATGGSSIALQLNLGDSNPDLFHAIDSRPVWWTGPEAGDWSPASSVDRDCTSRLVSSLVISVVVKLTFSFRTWRQAQAPA